MSLGLHLTCEEYVYHIYSHLSLNINNLDEKSESNLDSREIKTSPKSKRADTLNKRVKSEERISSQSG
jgi:hypothetical protein